MLKRTLFAFLLVASCITANAQGFRFGATAGLNVNVARGSDPCGATLGYVFGGNVLYDFTDGDDTWYLGSALLLSQKGFKQDNIFDGYEKPIDIRHDMTALEMPFVVGKNFPIGNKGRFFVEAGPYISCSLWGTTKVKQDGKSDKHHDIFGKNKFNRLDCGLTLGVGADISNKVRVKCSYELGLPNMINNSVKIDGVSTSTYRNGTIATTLTYLF